MSINRRIERRMVLRALLRALMLATVIFILLAFVQTTAYERVLFLLVCVPPLLAFVVAEGLLSRNRLTWSGRITLGALWYGIIIAMYYGGGVRSPAFGFCLLTVLAAGIVLGQRDAIICTLLSIIAGLSYFALEQNGLLPPTREDLMSLGAVTSNSVNLLLVVYLILVTMRSMSVAERTIEQHVDSLRQSQSDLVEENRVRQMAEKQLRQRVGTERLLNEISAAFISCTVDEIDDRVVWALGRMAAVFGIERAFVALLEPTQTDRISMRYEWHPATYNPVSHRFQHMATSSFGSMETQLSTDRVIIVDNMANLPPDQVAMRRIMQSIGVESLLVVPLMMRDVLSGIIGFWGVNGDLSIWTEEKATLLNFFAGIVSNALARKQAMLTLRQNESRYRALFERNNDAVFIVSLDENILAVNERAVELFGYREQELLSMKLNQLMISNNRMQPMHMGRAMYTQTAPIYERQFVRKDGIRFPGEVNLALVMDEDGHPQHLQSIVRDISARKAVEVQLKRALNETRALYGVSSLLIGASDLEQAFETIAEQLVQNLPVRHARIIWVEQADRRILIDAQAGTVGPIAAEATFDALWNGLPGWVMREGQLLVSRAGVPDTRLDERTRMAREQSELGDIVVAPLVIHNAVIGFVQVARHVSANDFTQRDIDLLKVIAGQISITVTNRRLLSDLQHSNVALSDERASLAERVQMRTQELQRAYEQLARASEMKDNFLASMSHELRTPLNAVISRADMLAQEVYGPISSRQRRAVSGIEKSGLHLLALINDILDVAKIESGETKLETSAVNVRSVCQESLELVRDAASTKGHTLSLNYECQVCEVEADARRLKQILVNLLSNAVKFTPNKGAVGLDVFEQPATNMLELTVWDTGIGVPEAEQEHLFDPFVQLDTRLNREHQGTGLGLSLVKRLTELHGGTVRLESKPGEGSRFTIALPLPVIEGAQPAETTSDCVALTPEVSDSHEIKENKMQQLVLVADDNALNRETICDFLNFKNYETIEAVDGNDAIAKLKMHQPGIVLMDVQMPRKDGLQATRELREAGVATPIIALTGLAMIGDDQRCLEAGASAYLSKPVRLDELVRTIERELQRSV